MNVIGWGTFSPVNLSGVRIPLAAPEIKVTPKIQASNIDSITVSWLSVRGAQGYELFQTKINTENSDNWIKIGETTNAQYKVYGLEKS